MPYWGERHKVPGLLEDIDFLLFDRILKWQQEFGETGDLLEVGTFLGKTAIVLGQHLGDGEQLVVCDVFQDPGVDSANTLENQDSYAGLTKRAFEANYLRYVEEPATIIQDRSSNIRLHVDDASIRFAHVDGGHLYDVVRDDVVNVRCLMSDFGIVAFDDFRAEHTPGVAAAVWEAVATSGLIPVCLTGTKFYGSWNTEAAAKANACLQAWLGDHPEVRSGSQQIAGCDVLLVSNPVIWTRRRRVKAMLPPLLTQRLLRRPEPHLGDPPNTL